MFRRRPVARAAAVGAVAVTAGKAGANAAAADAAPPEQPAPAQQAAPEAAAETAAPGADQNMQELTKLKELLDSGVLTQAEFDAQKQKILQTM